MPRVLCMATNLDSLGSSTSCTTEIPQVKGDGSPLQLELLEERDLVASNVVVKAGRQS